MLYIVIQKISISHITNAYQVIYCQVSLTNIADISTTKNILQGVMSLIFIQESKSAWRLMMVSL